MIGFLPILVALSATGCGTSNHQVVKFLQTGDIDAETPVYLNAKKVGEVVGINRADSVTYVVISLRTAHIPQCRFTIQQDPFLKDVLLADSTGPAPENQTDTLTGIFKPSAFISP